jgi:hypothetical protein
MCSIDLEFNTSATMPEATQSTPPHGMVLISGETAKKHPSLSRSKPPQQAERPNQE